MPPALSVIENQQVVSEFFQRESSFSSCGSTKLRGSDSEKGYPRAAESGTGVGARPAAMKEEGRDGESLPDAWRVEDSLGPQPPVRAGALDPKGPVRKGKWTPEEEKYTTRIINDFTKGLLPLAPGTTLRSYLSEKLNCDPMRITKKFAGAACIGKRVFQPAERTPENLSESQRSRRELDDMARKFHARLDSMKPVRSSSKAAAATAAASSSPKTRRSTAQAAGVVGTAAATGGGEEDDERAGRSRSGEVASSRRLVSRSPSPATATHGPHSVYDDSAPHPEGSPSQSWDREIQEGGYGHYDPMDQSPTSTSSSQNNDNSAGPTPSYLGGGGGDHAPPTSSCQCAGCARNVGAECSRGEGSSEYQQNHQRPRATGSGGYGTSTHEHHQHQRHQHQAKRCSSGNVSPISSPPHCLTDLRQGGTFNSLGGRMFSSFSASSLSLPPFTGGGSTRGSGSLTSLSSGKLPSLLGRRAGSGPLQQSLQQGQQQRPCSIPESAEISDQDAGGLLLDFFRSVHEKVQTASEELDNVNRSPSMKRSHSQLELAPPHPLMASKRGPRSISSPALTQFAHYAEKLPRLETPVFKRRKSVESFLFND
ncbi:unnamed protein product [Discosporangium mesarthrocarpum]